MKRYHARWVIPVGAPPLRDGTVAVDGERITWIGARSDAPRGDDTELGDAVLMPGLVNAHVHLDLTAFQGVLPRRPFFAWIRALVRALAETADDSMLHDASLWTVADQLAHGVTTLAHTGPSRAAFDALRALGARGVAFAEVFGPDPAHASRAMQDLDARITAWRAQETSLVKVGVSPHAPYSVSDELFRRVGAFARAEGLPSAVHIAESEEETALVREGSGAFGAMLRDRGIRVEPRAASPVALLEATGMLDARPLCIHAVQVDADDVARMRNAGAAVAHCPRANAWFGHGNARVAAFRDAGIPVAIGTDSAAGNDGLRLLDEARAAADQRLRAGARLALATRDGAHALGLADRIGVLAPGMEADTAAFPVHDVQACDTDPELYVLEHCADVAARMTIVAGNVVAEHGVAVRLPGDVAPRLGAHQSRVAAWAAGQGFPGVANGSVTFLDSDP